MYKIINAQITPILKLKICLISKSILITKILYISLFIKVSIKTALKYKIMHFFDVCTLIYMSIIYTKISN